MFEALFLLFIALPIGLAISAAVGVIIASAKGRSGFEGGAWGCLLGPIGWIIVALLPTQEKVSPQTHRTCPYCAETVLRAAQVCRHCGRQLSPAQPAEPRSGLSPEEAALRRKSLLQLVAFAVLGLIGVIAVLVLATNTLW